MKTNSWLPLALASAALVTPVSVVQANEASRPSAPPTHTAVTKATMDPSVSVTHVGMALLAQQLAATPTGNLAFSPYSLTSTLALLQTGSRGETAKALATALALPGPDTLSGGAFAVAEQDQPGVQFRVANGVFLAHDQPLLASFGQRARKDFSARTKRLDFARPDARDKVNAWFARGTGGKIPALLTRLSPDTRVLVGNALYFKGLWATPFDAAKTDDQLFCETTACDASMGKVPSMHATGLMAYHENAYFQRVELPFAGGRYALNIVLPNPGKSPADLLTAEANLASVAMAEPALPRRVRLQLPRFTLESGGEFRPALQAIGFAPLFQPEADFSGLSSKPLVFGSVMHKVSMAIDEAGAEAAAATAVMGLRSALPTPPETEMTVNRPFLALLVDRQKRLPVVMAVIRSPAR